MGCTLANLHQEICKKIANPLLDRVAISVCFCPKTMWYFFLLNFAKPDATIKISTIFYNFDLK